MHRALRRRRGFVFAGAEALDAVPGPVILACNHAHTWDTVFITCATRRPFTVCGARPVYFSSWRKRRLMALLRIIEVTTWARFEADTAARLGRGEALLIYPEMGRNPDGMGAFRDWAARVAGAHGVPVVPLYLHGTETGHAPRPVWLRYGAPLWPAADEGPDAFTQRIRSAIEGLRAQGQPA